MISLSLLKESEKESIFHSKCLQKIGLNESAPSQETVRMFRERKVFLVRYKYPTLFHGNISVHIY